MSEPDPTDFKFLNAAKDAAKNSDDPDTRVGCVIVCPDNMKVLSAGANAFPGSLQNESGDRNQRPLKYKWIEHAERTAIFGALSSGVSVSGGWLYLSGGFPCADCARAIIAVGLARVVASRDLTKTRHWESDYEISREMFRESDIAFIELNESDLR